MEKDIRIDQDALLERFFRYVALDTQSDPASKDSPSTPGQFDLAHLLADELRELGLQEVTMDDRAYVMGSLPANTSAKAPVIGFIAHLDTSPDMSGKNVRPQLHQHYDGKALTLNKAKGVVMKPSDFPSLKKYSGQTLITSDGTTLLGADDKAGIAEIMTALQTLRDNPDILHGGIRVGFTPDEEIGRGADHFDVARFGADFAYTMDGGELGELQYENFNAAYANIHIAGRNIHPGDAKDKMINACLVGMELNQMLPAEERPEHTTNYAGFYHLTTFRGTVEQASLEYIIRDHNHQQFESRKNHLRHCVNQLKERYGHDRIRLDMKDQYYNMHARIHDQMHIIDLAREAMEKAGVKPLIRPIRGGTDGARLSYMGLPCPNLFTGGHHFHGRYECIPLESMVKATQTIVEIVKLAANKTGNSLP